MWIGVIPEMVGQTHFRRLQRAYFDARRDDNVYIFICQMLY